MDAGASGGYTSDTYHCPRQLLIVTVNLGASCTVFEAVSNASVITVTLNAGLVAASQWTMDVSDLT